jgi:hypothetical protein
MIWKEVILATLKTFVFSISPGGTKEKHNNICWANLILAFAKDSQSQYLTTGGLPPLSSSWRQASLRL